MKTSQPRKRLHREAVTAASGAVKQKMETWSREVTECPEQTQVTVCSMWINSNISFVIDIKQIIFTKDSVSLLFFFIAQTWIDSMTASHMTCTLLTEQQASCCYPPSCRTSIIPLLRKPFGSLLWTFSAFNKRSHTARVGFCPEAGSRTLPQLGRPCIPALLWLAGVKDKVGIGERKLYLSI